MPSNFNEYKMHFFISYKKHGIYALNAPKSVGKKIDSKTLKLPIHIKKLLKIYEKMFKNTNFDTHKTSLKLARELKRHFRNDAYIEYEDKNGIFEMKYYYVMADVHYLHDEWWECVDIESMGVEVTKDLVSLNAELIEWNSEYDKEIDQKIDAGATYLDGKIYRRIMRQGYNLTLKLQSMLPPYYVIYYSEDMD